MGQEEPCPHLAKLLLNEGFLCPGGRILTLEVPSIPPEEVLSKVQEGELFSTP